MRLLVAGTLTLDTLEVGSGPRHEGPGGSALYAAAAAGLFAPTAVVGIVGTDFPLEHFDFLSERGVDLGGVEVRPGPTFRWRARYLDETDGRDRVIVSRDQGVASGVVPTVPVGLVEDCPALLLASTDPAVQTGVLDQVPRPGWVGLDTMEHWITDSRAHLNTLLPRTDILFATEREICLLGGSVEAADAADRVLSTGPAAVVVKRGHKGASLIRRDGSTIEVPARSTGTILETTGAGDAFAGAFMASTVDRRALDDGAALYALAQGSAAAALAIRDAGIDGLREVTRQDRAEAGAYIDELISGRSNAGPSS